MLMTSDCVSISPCTIDGFLAYSLRNPNLALIVVPELGGKIVSLRSGSKLQTEWLWKNDRIGYKPAELDHKYTQQHDTGGIDECFPSVDACELPQRERNGSDLTLHDHGELYGRPWGEHECKIAEGGSAIVRLKQHCQTLPVTFERRLLLAPNNGTIRFEYRVENLSDNPIPFSWCMHPALAITPGMQLRLPDNHHLYCSYASDNAPLTTGDQFRWPLTSNGTDMSVIPDPDTDSGYAAKLLSRQDLFDCTSGNSRAIAGLENPATGEALHFVLPPSEVPHIALWLNYRGWAGDGGTPYFNLVLEPAIGNADSLRELLDRGTAPAVPPHTSRNWSFEIHATTPPLC
ncbi:hypothetical protein [Microbulbifer sp. ARAS458-1]|uniref:aldose epimerase family protein n=1 Tax=Microbulbifer sp. ARAS458-1 TaxID=3140242 RepID=UPI003877DA48